MPLSAPTAPLTDLAAGLISGRMDLRELLSRTLDLVESRDAEIQALLPEPDRRERLEAEAEALLKRYPQPEGRPPLFGILVGVKDIFRVDGHPTRCGSALPAELFDGPEASLVTRLKSAGALVLGKTVTTEFAYFPPGPTRNPRNPGHTPGGSSSGSAAAVAAGYCPLALGSQTVGSVIRPAAFCGVVGIKPSFGLLSLDGVIPYSPALDHAGFFVNSAVDLPLVLSVLSPSIVAQKPSPGVLGVPDGPYLTQASPEGLAAFEVQIARLQDSGWTVKRIPAMQNIVAINRRHNWVAAGELADVHRAWFARYAELYRPRTADWIRHGASITPDQLRVGRDGRMLLRDELEQLMDQNGVEAWISPAAPGPAPEGIESTGDPAMNLPWTHAGVPVVSLPAGSAGSGLPLGLQVAGRFGRDAALIALAQSLAEALRE